MSWYTVASSVIAALLASFLTYWFGFRSKKQEIILHERLRAFQSIQQRLALIARYCRASAAASSGSEFAPRVSDLPAEAQSSALAHWTALQFLIDNNLHVLPSKPRRALEAFGQNLSGLASMELALHDPSPDPRIVGSAASTYEDAATAAEGCIETVYESLKLPR